MISYVEVDPAQFLQESHPSEKKYPDHDWDAVFSKLWSGTLIAAKDRMQKKIDLEERMRFRGLVGNVLWMSLDPEREFEDPVRVWEHNGEVRTGHSIVAAHVALSRIMRVHYCRAPLCGVNDRCPEYEPKPVQEQLSGNVALGLDFPRKRVLTPHELEQLMTSGKQEIANGLSVKTFDARNYR